MKPKGKPAIYLKDGRWDWWPNNSRGTEVGSNNYAACMWCLNRNIKEGR